MKCFNDTYEYAADVDPKTNQYGIVDFSKIEYVEARYVKHFDPRIMAIPVSKHCPDLEALKNVPWIISSLSLGIACQKYRRFLPESVSTDSISSVNSGSL